MNKFTLDLIILEVTVYSLKIESKISITKKDLNVFKNVVKGSKTKK